MITFTLNLICVAFLLVVGFLGVSALFLLICGLLHHEPPLNPPKPPLSFDDLHKLKGLMCKTTEPSHNKY